MRKVVLQINKCKLCGKEFAISVTALKKKGRGQFCSALCQRKGKWTSETRAKVSNTNKKLGKKPPSMFGKDHWAWKGEMPKCIDCGAKLTHRKNKTGLCIKCAGKIKKGIKRPKDVCKKISEGQKGKYVGEKSSHWYKDRSLLKKSDNRRLDVANKEWSLKVKNRDFWKCKINNKDCKGRLEAHHILPWRDYPELRYEINNGITLCVHHHPHSWNEEKRLAHSFKCLILEK